MKNKSKQQQQQQTQTNTIQSQPEKPTRVTEEYHLRRVCCSARKLKTKAKATKEFIL